MSGKRRPELDVFVDSDGEEGAEVMKRYDNVDVYEYELPEDFEDEEIDEDEAFNEEDYKKYGDLGGKRKRENDDDPALEDAAEESASDFEEDDGEDVVDLDSLLDAEPQPRHPKKKPLRAAVRTNDSDSDLGSFSPGLDDDDEDEEDDDKRDSIINAFMDIEGMPKRKKRKVTHTEALQESEFNIPNHGLGTVSLTDLVGSIDAAGYASLKKQVRELNTTDATLAAPLPRVVADRITRSVAYKDTNKQVSEWNGVVQKNRRKEHLSFPMNAPARQNVTTNTITAGHAPRTDMEQEVTAILQGAGMDEMTMKKAEVLAMNKMSPEERAARQAQLARNRSLMFFMEQKAKRMKKIKSKSYRKIAKKEREKNRTLMYEELKVVDPEAAEQLALTQEKKRAEERLTLKYRNNSKWAQHVKKQKNVDKDTRKAMVEKNKLSMQLRKKIDRIEGHEDGDGFSEDEEEDEEEESEGEVEGETPREALARKNKKTAELIKKVQEEDIELPDKGLMSYKFMRKGFEKKRKQAEAQAAALLEELEADALPSNVWADDEVVPTGDDEEAIEARKKGAKKFNLVQSTDLVQEVGVSAGRTLRSSRHISIPLRGAKKSGSTGGGVDVDEDEDEVVDDGIMNQQQVTFDISTVETGGDGKKSRKERKKEKKEEKKKEMMGASPSGAATTKKNKTKKGGLQKSALSKQDDDGEEVQDEDNPWLLSADDAKRQMRKTDTNADRRAKDMAAARAETETKTKKKKKKKSKKVEVDASATLDVADGAEDKFQLKVDDETQRELISEAFAGDDVEEDFETEKQALVDEENHVEVEIKKAGWGSWTGEGVKKKRVRQRVKDAKPEKPKKARKDDKLKHVIINEKRDKKAAAWLTSEVPRGFPSRDAFERSSRNPLGPDWNTSASFSHLTKPKVSTKMGAIIAPLQKTRAAKKAQKLSRRGLYAPKG